MKLALQEEEKFYFELMGELPCYEDVLPASLSEIEEGIAECQGMLSDAINRADKSEISFWRKMLQKEKIMRREILTD